MKHILLSTILIILSILSCSNDAELEGKPYIKLDEVKNFYPSEYKNEQNVIFINALGTEKTLEIGYLEEITDESFQNGLQFKQDKVLANIVSTDGSVGILMSGGAFLNDDLSDVRPSVNFFMTSLSTNIGLQLHVRLDQNRASTICDGNVDDSIEILNKNFNNVFSAICIENESFSELYVNDDVGVVAFKDVENVLWRFEKFTD